MSEQHLPEPVVDQTADAPAPATAEAVVSIVRHLEGEAVVARGRLVAHQPSSITVQLDEPSTLPSGTALAVVVHGVAPMVSLATLTAGNSTVVTLRLSERRN